MEVEVCGTICAGFDTPMMEETRYQMDLQKYVLEYPNSSVFVRVRGNSMKDAGIFPDDMLVVDKSAKPKHGDIVIACIDNKYTLKFFQTTSSGQVFLRPGNSTYKDIFPKESLEIFGVIKTMIRKYS